MAALGSILCPAGAFAHATLEGAVPAAGATVKVAPRLVTLSFSEAVEGNFGSLSVYDPAGKRIDTGEPYHPAGQGTKLAVRLGSAASKGTSTVTFRVVSADSHVIAGGYTFSVGYPSAPSATVAQLSQQMEAPTSTRLLMGAARAAQFGAITIALGSVLFLLLVWQRIGGQAGAQLQEFDPALRRRVAILIRAGAAVGAVASIAGVLAQGAIAAGLDPAAALSAQTVGDTLATRFGEVWSLGFLAWVAIGLGAGLLARGQRTGALLTLPLGFVAALPALSGHAAARANPGIESILNVLHVSAVSAWLGGVVVLLSAVLPLAAGPHGVARIVGDVMRRFSTVALCSVVAVLATGVAQTALTLDSPSQLLATSYGRAVLIKVAGVLLLIGLGAAHRRFVLAQLLISKSAEAASSLARKLLLAETGLFSAVLIATAALASFSPNAGASAGPVARQIEAGPISIQVNVDPARVGSNAVHLLLADAKTGAPYEKALQVTASETLADKGIGPLSQQAHRAGPGHWIATGVALPAAGEWKLAVTVRVSEFDEYSGDASLPVT